MGWSALAAPPPPAHRASLQAAREARKAGDAKTFLQHTTALIGICRDHPDSLLFHAEALALAGRPADALATLLAVAALGVVFDPPSRPAFTAVRALPEFPALADPLAANASPVGTPEVTFRLPQQTGILEGIAYDGRRDIWYVSDVRHRRVLRRTPDGVVAPVLTERDGLLSAFGLAVDPARDCLWVCTSQSPAMLPAADAAVSALVRYDLGSPRDAQQTPAAVRRYPIPTEHGPTLIGDLALAASGDVYLSDTEARVIWRLAERADSVTALCADYGFASPQGLTLRDEEHLIVADYVLGLFEVNIRTGAVRRLGPIAGETLVGIDGLRWHRGHLYAAQNGIQRNRIVRIEFDPDGNPRALETLLRGPDIIEPTLFTSSDEHLWCVANSGWDRFQQPTETPLPPVDVAILRVPTR